MRVLQRAQQIARERMYHGDGTGSALQRTLKTFAIDPVAYSERQFSDDAGIVDMPDSGMVQAAERFGLTDEPCPGGLVGVEVHPQAHSAPEDQVLGFEEHALERYGYRALQPVSGAKRCVGALVVAGGLVRVQRSNPRRRSIVTWRPHTAKLHQRRRSLGESSVKKREQLSPAQRRTRSNGRERTSAADAAIAISKVGRCSGANLSCHSPLTRVSW